MIVSPHRFITFTLHITIILSLVRLQSAAALENQLPEQKPLNYYSTLWNDSALTRTPQVAAPEATSQLQEWILGGVLDLGDDYMVTLKHKTKPESHRFNLTDAKQNESTGISLKEVNMNSQNWKETKVAFADSKGKTHWLAFDLTRKTNHKTTTSAQVAVARTNTQTNNSGTPRTSQNSDKASVTHKRIFYNKPKSSTSSAQQNTNP